MRKDSLHIIAETTHWLAIHKPAGIVTEKTRSGVPSLESQAEHYLRANSRRQNPFLGIVHRLDKVTSGVLLMAKKKSALKALNEQFRERRVQKTYMTIVDNPPPMHEGELVHYLLKDTRAKRSVIHQTNVKGGSLVSLRYRIIQKRESQCLLEVIPMTGKYHQIRAQLAFVHSPITGDATYGSSREPSNEQIALHAHSLRFVDPETGASIRIEAWPPLPRRQFQYWAEFR